MRHDLIKVHFGRHKAPQFSDGLLARRVSYGSFVNSVHVFTLIYWMDGSFLHTCNSQRVHAQRLCSRSVESATLMGVREILCATELEFPILLDKGHNADGILVRRGTFCGRERDCSLSCDHKLCSESIRQVCIEGRTCAQPFPGASITS